ncbi:SatD family protein [soil metagenome]
MAVIGDVVKSRERAGTGWHRELVEALDRVNAQLTAEQPLHSTIGDEFQGLYRSVATALRATLLVRLELPGGLDCRFGVGVGGYAETLGSARPVQEGTAWWSARQAIVRAKSEEAGRHPSLRTWYEYEPDEDELAAPLHQGPTNAYLLARDHLVSHMDARSRRLLLGTIQGRTQTELAASEGIGQSAVSRNLRRNGAYAVLEGADLIGSTP